MPSVPRERHTEYYFSDGTVHLLILGPTRHTLYKLYPGLLLLRSSVLESLLSLPQPRSQPGIGNVEGTSDENPIVLHGVIQSKFDYLLTFLSGGYAGEQNCKEYLIAILKLSDFFDIPHGFQYAVAELSRFSPLEASLKLQLGHQYHVDQWVEPAFRDLMSRPFSSITRAEACHIGVEYFYILAHTKLLVEESYRAVAYTAPPLVQPASCTTPLRCEASWKDEWWNGVARQLLHPEDPCRSNEILALLDTAKVPGVCAACKEAVTSKIRQSDALRQEETLGNITMLEVMELQMDEHIRASFRQLNSC